MATVNHRITILLMSFLITQLFFIYSLQCPFIDVTESEDRLKETSNASAQRSSPDSNLFKHVMVEDALRALIESIRHRTGLLNIYNKSAPSNPGEPDIR